jgi:pimeloyl-ACP methyl ester carboxylesterase
MSGTDEAYRYGAALASSKVEVVPEVRHWCFREDPAVVDCMIKFLGPG